MNYVALPRLSSTLNLPYLQRNLCANHKSLESTKRDASHPLLTTDEAGDTALWLPLTRLEPCHSRAIHLSPDQNLTLLSPDSFARVSDSLRSLFLMGNPAPMTLYLTPKAVE